LVGVALVDSDQALRTLMAAVGVAVGVAGGCCGGWHCYRRWNGVGCASSSGRRRCCFHHHLRRWENLLRRVLLQGIAAAAAAAGCVVDRVQLLLLARLCPGHGPIRRARTA